MSYVDKKKTMPKDLRLWAFIVAATVAPALLAVVFSPWWLAAYVIHGYVVLGLLFGDDM